MNMHDIVLYLLTPFGFFFVWMVLFWPLEKLFPARKQKFFRSGWLTDLYFFFGQYLIWIGLVFYALAQFKGWVDGVMPASFRTSVAAQPFWLQAYEVIFLSDLLIYWGHRLQHQVDFLWRFHATHHTARHLDWLAAHREHPVDTIYTIGLINLPGILLGFSLSSISAFIMFRGIWAIYIHSNVKLPIGPLKLLIGSPEMHRWHHYLERDAGNYSNLSPLMDLAFGTHTCPDHEPSHLGIKERIAHNYLGHMLWPFKRRVKAAPLKLNVAEKNTLPVADNPLPI